MRLEPNYAKQPTVQTAKPIRESDEVVTTKFNIPTVHCRQVLDYSLHLEPQFQPPFVLDTTFVLEALQQTFKIEMPEKVAQQFSKMH